MHYPHIAETKIEKTICLQINELLHEIVVYPASAKFFQALYMSQLWTVVTLDNPKDLFHSWYSNTSGHSDLTKHFPYSCQSLSSSNINLTFDVKMYFICLSNIICIPSKAWNLIFSYVDSFLFHSYLFWIICKALLSVCWYLIILAIDTA